MLLSNFIFVRNTVRTASSSTSISDLRIHPSTVSRSHILFCADDAKRRNTNRLDRKLFTTTSSLRNRVREYFLFFFLNAVTVGSFDARISYLLVYFCRPYYLLWQIKLFYRFYFSFFYTRFTAYLYTLFKTLRRRPYRK